MRDFNKAIVLGNLTRDPEMRYTPNGQPVCSFAIATNRRWNDPAGNLQEATEFHEVVAWGKLAEIANQILYKGRKTLVEGRLQTRNWEGQDGVKRYKTEIVAENISALGPAGAKESTKFEKDIEAESPKSDSKEIIEEAEKDKKSEKKETTDKKEKTASKETKEKEEDKVDLDDIPF